MAADNGERRNRSRSPRNNRAKSGGLRWKTSQRREDGKDQPAGLQRGYRHDHDGYRERENARRERSRSRERKPTEVAKDDTLRPERTQDDEANADAPHLAHSAETRIDADILAKFGPQATIPVPATKEAPSKANDDVIARPVNAAPPKPRVGGGPMIVVKINDRLGTTSKVPCLASDTVGDFKKMVAMRIGRKPHEIMLKRQSERPFKDFLTLADYNVSDGVQLDLELDTGD